MLVGHRARRRRWLAEPGADGAVRARRDRRCAAPAAPTTTSSTAISTARSRAPPTGRSRPARSASGRRSPSWSSSSLIGLAILLSFNRFAIWLGVAVAGPGRHLSVHEADHLVAAVLPRPHLQLGRADRLGRGRRHARAAAAAALCRRHLLDPRLRHDLRAPGQGGRRADRREVVGAAAGRQRTRPALFAFYAGAVVAARGRRLPQRSSAGRSTCCWRRRRCSSPGRRRRVDIDDAGRLPRQVQVQPAVRLARARGHRRRAALPRERRRPAAFVRAQTAIARRRWCRRSGCISPREVTPLWQATEESSPPPTCRRPTGPSPGPAARRWRATCSTIRRCVARPARARFRRRLRHRRDRRREGRRRRGRSPPTSTRWRTAVIGLNAALQRRDGRDRHRDLTRRRRAGRWDVDARRRRLLRATDGRGGDAWLRALVRRRRRRADRRSRPRLPAEGRARRARALRRADQSLELEDRTLRTTRVLRLLAG